VVFETDERAGLDVIDLRVDHNVADEAFLAGFGFDVDEADAWETLALGRLVVVAQQLVAAANGEDRGARLHRHLKRWLLVLQQVFVHQGLLAVLTAAKEKDVNVLHVLGRAAAEL